MDQEIYSYKKAPKSKKAHVLSAWLMHRPGALSRVVSLFRRRRFNIISITAGESEKKGVYRLTFVVDSEKTDVAQVIHQVEKLIEVIKVEDITHLQKVTRELTLIKVRTPSGKQAGERAEMLKIVGAFKGKIVHEGRQSLIVELTGKSEHIENFAEAVKKFGILEMARTGMTSMVK
jgi:acetolactate synthase-1/3 small subunit